MALDRRGVTGSWVVVGSLWVVLAGANAYYIVPSGILPVIMERLDVGPTAASLLVSVMFGTQVLVGVPVGIVLDRVDNRAAIAVASFVLVVSYVWSFRAAGAGGFGSILAARSVATVGTAAIWAASINVTGRAFSPERRATAVAVVTSAPPGGFALGLVSGPAVADWFGWTTIFLVYALPVVIGCLLFWVASRGLTGTTSGGSTAQSADFVKLLSTRSIWLVASMAFLGFSLYAFVTSWAPTYLTDSLGVSMAYGGLFAALFPAIGILARGGSGYVSDRLFAHRRRPVALLSFVVSAPAIVLLAVTDNIAIVIGALLVSGLFVQLGLGLFYAQARELADPSVVATAIGLTTSLAVFGGFVAPILGGYLIEHSGYDAAFGYAVVMAVLGSLLAWYSPEPEL
ncbi:MAG: MFS transporter [Natronomonas sp.]